MGTVRTLGFAGAGRLGPGRVDFTSEKVACADSGRAGWFFAANRAFFCAAIVSFNVGFPFKLEEEALGRTLAVCLGAARSILGFDGCCSKKPLAFGSRVEIILHTLGPALTSKSKKTYFSADSGQIPANVQ